MRRFLLLVALVAPLFVHAQQIRQVFVNMPDTLCPILTEVNREDCFDFLACDMKAEVTNRFGGVSELKAASDDYLLFDVSEHVSWQIKLLPWGNTQLICFVRTVAAPVHDSQVLFYNADWEPLSAAKFITMPQKGDFFVADATSDSLSVWQTEAFPTLMKVTLSPTEPTLSIAYTTPTFIRKETADKLQPFLRKEELLYRWNGDKFAR